MSTTNIFQVSLEVWGCLICIAVGIFSGDYVFKIGGALKHLWLMLLTSGMMLCCDASAYIFRGDMHHFGLYMTRLSNFGLFFTEGILTLLFVFMVNTLVTGKEELSIKEKWVQICLACIALHFVGTMATPIFGFYYTIDELNRYHREFGVNFSFALLGISIFIACLQLYRNRRSFSLLFIHAFRFALLFFALCFTVQFGIYGLSLINIGLTAVLLLLFCVLWYDTARHANELRIDALEQIIADLQSEKTKGDEAQS